MDEYDEIYYDKPIENFNLDIDRSTSTECHGYILYGHKKIHVKLTFPSNYPSGQPTCWFDKQIYHPNSHTDGHICLHCYPTSGVHSIRNTILCLLSLLTKPSGEVWNKEAFQLFISNPQSFKDKLLASL